MFIVRMRNYNWLLLALCAVQESGMLAPERVTVPLSLDRDRPDLVGSVLKDLGGPPLLVHCRPSL